MSNIFQRRRNDRFKTSTVKMKSTDIVLDFEKRFFGEDNNFIDYFMEVGVKPEIYKNNNIYEVNSASELNKYLHPKIITKFPNFDKRNVTIESSMVEQIFPHGFKAIESKTQLAPQFYCIILDNQLYSAVYTNKYLACLVIYESLHSYKTFADKCKIAENKNINLMRNTYSGRYMRLNTVSPLKRIYIPKCLCLISVHPYINEFEEILRQLYQLSLSNKYPGLFMESIIEKIVIEIPKVPRGHKKIILKFPEKEIEIKENKMNDFPSINVNLYQIFEIFSVEKIIDIFRYLLFETKMVFFSKDLNRLTNAILCFVNLLTPFKYQFQIASVISKKLYKFLETISPFIFGVNETYTPNFIKENKIKIEDTLCIADIDNKDYIIFAKGGSMNESDYPEFPKKLKEILEKGLSKLQSSKCLENKEYQIVFGEFMIELLKDYTQFLTKDYSVTKDISMNTKDMIDIKSYVNIYKKEEKDFYKKLFDTQMFIEFIYKRMMPKDCSEKVEVLFFEEKINEKIAGQKIFGGSKILSQNVLLPCKDYDFLPEIPITEDAESGIMKIEFSCDANISKNLSEHILSYQPLNKIEQEFFDKGYLLKIDEDNVKISFEYSIFPSIIGDKLFILNIENFNIPDDLCTKINFINDDIVNKSHLKFIMSKKELKNSPAENNLYHCYLILWAITLWYSDKSERDYRFIEMLKILEKCEEHDIKIFELLFKALVEHSTDENVILLYKKFIRLRLNPSWEIFSTVSKIIKKKQNATKKKQLLRQEITSSEVFKNFLSEGKIKENLKSGFRPRTFRIVKNNEAIFTNNILFYAYRKCGRCQGIINLKEICSNLNLLKMEREFGGGDDKVKCHNKIGENGKICGFLNEVNLRFRYGEELFNQKTNNNGANKVSSSIFISIGMFSPAEIKKELMNIIFFSKKSKLDVDMFSIDFYELFWNIIWYFELNHIDKSFMLPYAPLKIKFTPLDEIKSCVLSEEKNVYNSKKKVIDVHKGQKIPFEFLFNFNNNNPAVPKKYKDDDLCIQNVYDLGIIENIGMISFKNIFAYEGNLGYNVRPLIFYDKDNNLSETDSIFFMTRTENSELSSSNLIRESICIRSQKSDLPFVGAGSSDTISKMYKFDNKESSKQSLFSSCASSVILFEQSDESSDENNENKVEGEGEEEGNDL